MADFEIKNGVLIKYTGKERETVIPDGVRKIGISAFRGCRSLTSVTIPDSVTVIGASAFKFCSSLTAITIPEGVTEIGWDAFMGCSSLTSITLPDGVTKIGERTFEDCRSLTDITIPAGVKKIDLRAFYGCDSLKSVNIPYGVKKLGYKVFSDCLSLTSITIPDSVTQIGASAFEGCSGLTGINIPDSVTSICDYAFHCCEALTYVRITDIAKWCEISFGDNNANPLYYAGKLYLNGELVTDLVIPNSVTKIGASAFEGCSSLINVTIPDSVSSIGKHAFRLCENLTSVCITDIAKWCRIYFWNYAANPLYYARRLYLNGELVTDLVIPDSVTKIYESAFRRCSSLTSVTIPDSVTEICDNAFCTCSGLKRVKIGDGVAQIPKQTFGDCSSLIEIFINAKKLYLLKDPGVWNQGIRGSLLGEGHRKLTQAEDVALTKLINGASEKIKNGDWDDVELIGFVTKSGLLCIKAAEELLDICKSAECRAILLNYLKDNGGAIDIDKELGL